MTPLPAPRSTSLGPVLLLLTLSAGCGGDDLVGPAPPASRPLAATGQIVVSVFADRSELEFTVTIDGAGTWIVRSNDDVRVEGLVPGRYLLDLRLPGSLRQAVQPCLVRDGTQRMATVRAGETTAVQYLISCGSAPDRPRDKGVS